MNKIAGEPTKLSPKLIPPHGGYRKLKSYQNAKIVYDTTVAFCDRFVDRRSWTHYQMVQAARSGKQNIAEGSMASGASKKTELKLVGVARGRDSKRCFSTLGTFCGSGNLVFGRKITRRCRR